MICGKKVRSEKHEMYEGDVGLSARLLGKNSGQAVVLGSAIAAHVVSFLLIAFVRTYYVILRLGAV